MCMVLLLLSAFTHAQIPGKEGTPLTINEVWKLTDSNSKRIRMQQLELQSASARVGAARSERLPEIAANGVLAHVFPLPIYENGLFHTPAQYPVDSKYYKVSADAYLNLYNGGKTNREIETAKTEYALATAKKELNRQEIHFNAAVCFYDVYRNRAYRELLLQDIKERKKQLEEITQLYRHGTVLKSDVLRAELRLSKQNMLLTEIENNIRIAAQKLNILTGMPDETMPEPMVQDTLPDQVLLKGVGDYLTAAQAQSFKLQASKQEQELRVLQLKQAKSNVLPSFGLFAEYMYAYPQIQFYPYSLSLYSNGMAGFKLKVPISSFYTNKHKVKVAELQLKQQETEDEAVQDDIRQEVQETYIRYQESLKRIDVASEHIRQAAESYRIVQNTYFNQLSLLTDLLDAETQLLQSRFELTTAKVNAKIQYYQLQKAVGNL